MIVREDYKFRQDLCVPCYDTDSSFRLKPAAFMDLAQDIAQYAADQLGFGYDKLHEHHIAWVLTRMHIHFEDYPLWRDEVSLTTWHKGFNGLFFLRDFLLDRPDGKNLVRCTSSWVVIDERERKMVRPELLLKQLEVTDVDDAIETPAPKTALPKGAVPEKIFEHKVSYSDVDIIGHTNNVRYVVWAMDALDYGFVSRHPVKDIYISFIKETLPGQTVSLFSLETEEGWYVEGRVDDKPVYCVRFVF
ncbi:MAG: hypothetical protein II652_02235 [Bacteroidales bacterium]|nr:hypothetical protein [Bacteroidales bacterium]